MAQQGEICRQRAVCGRCEAADCALDGQDRFTRRQRLSASNVVSK